MAKVTVSLVILLSFVLSLLLVHNAGISARSQLEAHDLSEIALPLHTANTTTDVHALWKNEGVHGRIAVHLGRYLHFLPIDQYDGYKTDRKSSLHAENLLGHYERNVTSRNFLWAAMVSNMAREIYHVMPADTFLEKKRLNVGNRPGENPSQDEIVLHYYGSRRILTSRIPRINEPVLLNIDASYLTSPDVEAIAQELKRSGLVVGMITLCRSEDVPQVTVDERERLDALARLLRHPGN